MSWSRWFKSPPVVPVVQLSGGIDFKTVHFVKRCISLARARRNLKAMAILVSSEGGSGAQADIVAHLLREFCDEKGIKLYGFVDRYACSAALLPVAASDQIIVQPDSILGGCAASASHVKANSDFGLSTWEASSGEYSFTRDFSPIKVNEEREERFDKLMAEVIKEDTKNLFVEYRARRGDKLKPEVLGKIEAGEYFSGTDAVKSGLADSLGTIQKTILRDFPNAELYFVPLGNKRYLDRRYFNRSIKNGIWIFLFVILSYKIISYIIKLLVASKTAPKKNKQSSKNDAN